MDVEWQNIIFFAFLITWWTGGVILYLRHLQRQRAYLRHFPPVNGVPLDALRGDYPFGPRWRALFRATSQWQPDPELERQRRDLWRRWRYVLLWIFGFPFLVICMIFSVAVLVHAARSVRLLP